MGYGRKSSSPYGMRRVRQVQRARSKRAKRIDAGLRAPIAKTPEHARAQLQGMHSVSFRGCFPKDSVEKVIGCPRNSIPLLD